MPGPTEDSGETVGVSLFVIFCTVVNFFFKFWVCWLTVVLCGLCCGVLGLCCGVMDLGCSLLYLCWVCVAFCWICVGSV